MKLLKIIVFFEAYNFKFRKLQFQKREYPLNLISVFEF